ncbi:hypothetical protein O988_01672 [Pseudogymnoascus sp. VKM F-3808]|nr:hypothetical protein O988_01672 [Pseudogymnoascus sp. VKM F-3808]
MAPKSTILCSCGKKLKTEADLSAHLRDSPKHKKPLIKGNAAPNPVDLEAKSGPSALVKNMSSFHVASSSPPAAEAAKVPLVQCTAKIKGEEPEPICIAIEEAPAEKLEKLNANYKETQRLHDELREKLSELLAFEITTELRASIKKELKPALKKEIEDELRSELREDLKKLKAKMTAELMSELKSDFKNAIKEEIKNEFKMTVAYQLSSQTTNNVKTEPMDDLKSTLKDELKNELMKELKDSHKSEINEQSAKEPKEDWGICSDDTCESCGYCMDIVMV